MAEPRTIEQGSLLIASTFPFPPFEVERDGTDSGFDSELMRAVCSHLGLRWKLVKYDGDDCNSIFDGLRTGDYDVVVSGTSITPDREKVALFSEPYLEADQGMIVSAAQTPGITSADELFDQVVGVETGRTSDGVARELQAEGTVRDVRAYPCGGIVGAVEDLSKGRIGAILTLLPVAEWFAREDDDLRVVHTIPTGDQLGVAFAPGNVTLRDAVNQALADSREVGLIDRLSKRWLE